LSEKPLICFCGNNTFKVFKVGRGFEFICTSCGNNYMSYEVFKLIRK